MRGGHFLNFKILMKMRNIKIYYRGVLYPVGSTGILDRLSGLQVAILGRRYRAVGNADTGNRLVFADGYSDEKLVELYRRFSLIGLLMESNVGDYTEEQLRAYRNNLRQLSRVLYAKGLDRPTVMENEAQGLAGAWVSDYIAFTHSQLTGPVIPPGWCG